MITADLTMTDLVKLNSRPRKVKPEPCRCPAYRFPHRARSGECLGKGQAWCDSCGEPCGVVRLKDSFPFEYWGERGIHTDTFLVSDCCGADFVTGERE